MTEESIYVTLVYLYKNESRGRLLKLQAGPTYVSVREILKQFGVVNLASEDKVWIKRANEDECRPDNYELYLSLEWRKFDRCTIVISPTYPKSENLLFCICQIFSILMISIIQMEKIRQMHNSNFSDLSEIGEITIVHLSNF